MSKTFIQKRPRPEFLIGFDWAMGGGRYREWEGSEWQRGYRTFHVQNSARCSVCRYTFPAGNLQVGSACPLQHSGDPCPGHLEQWTL